MCNGYNAVFTINRKSLLSSPLFEDSKGIRLNKFISDSGYCSRREADKLIEANRVKINGRRPEIGVRVIDGDVVTVDGMAIESAAPSKKDRVYLAYNKPVGVTCTTEQEVKGNITDAVDFDERIFPIGRLDKASDGLILLTNDGDIVNKILRAENAHDKEYVVTVNKPVTADFAKKMASGVPILNTITKPCKVTIIGKNAFRIVLTQGLNRQIRRMCSHFGYTVTTLTRTRIMHIELANLRLGHWRKLNRDELQKLGDAVAQSSSESTKSGKSHKPKNSSRSGKPSKTQRAFSGNNNSKSAASPKQRSSVTTAKGGRANPNKGRGRRK